MEVVTATETAGQFHGPYPDPLLIIMDMIAAARGPGEDETDPGAAGGGTGTAATTGGGTGVRTGAGETAATPGTTGEGRLCRVLDRLGIDVYTFQETPPQL